MLVTINLKINKMKERILYDLQKIIDRISYGDIRRNTVESELESIKAEIEESLVDAVE